MSRNRPSPNHDDRKGTAVDMLVLHYTDTPDAATALDLLTDPATKVSAHYLVDTDGRVHALVAEDRRAWHAGVASWRGVTDINACSIGIELQNRGHSCAGPDGPEPYPDTQIAALIHLVRDIRRRHDIPDRRILGHSDVAPMRKQDPGAHFPWSRLAEAGIGLWPGPGPSDAPPVAGTRQVQAALARIGYGVQVDGRAGEETRSVITAFQRHFRPDRISGTADADTVSRIGVVDSLMNV
ncbi:MULTISPECIES: N-acetylmuramoyl-L-alanine amidase [unclassified Minwuia]|jgi:N-acetylmuramoyl-L-alanine amidase|uniref:N-acetylmuramoyl-L-alanine amidase n=1 Tax=unclassified Minwuia TaxID=2618799 RepID=UPI00247A281B|nr:MULTISPECIES: N-acetylmuramoyl-L-alanine amidase [unclassified Minwuia]